MKVLQLVPKNSLEYLDKSSIDTLEEAKKKGFHSVIIHGFKDGRIYTTSSARVNALELLGALEAAKSTIWEY